MDKTDKSREAFEVCFRDWTSEEDAYDRQRLLEKHTGGYYAHAETRQCYVIWQAARAELEAENKRLREALKRSKTALETIVGHEVDKYGDSKIVEHATFAVQEIDEALQEAGDET